MTTLDDDIARIAALRGKPANYYRQAEDSRVRHVLRPEVVGQVFNMQTDTADDLRWYDTLPPATRRFISEAPIPMNANTYAHILHQAGGDEEAVEGAVAAHIPTRIKGWLLRYFGRDHPSLRKYA